MMKLHCRHLLITLIFILGLILPSHAAISVSDFWRMGEDNGATPGGVPASISDNVGGRTLSTPAGPVFNNVVSSVASNKVGSTFCLNFISSTSGTNGTVPAPNDNFGLELWVKSPNLTQTGVLAYDGNTGANGFGLFQSNNLYVCLFGGVTFLGASPVTVGTWTHLAIVRNSGTATFYVNGIASDTTTAAPNATSGLFGVAINPAVPGADHFTGYLDEVRLFTFAAGQFSTNDLLLNAGPPVATTGLTNTLFATGVTLNGTVNPTGLATRYNFHYGTTTSYGSTNGFISLAAATTASAVTGVLSNLSPSTLYHYRIASTNSAGTNAGADLTFTTPAVIAPIVTTVAAAPVGSITATLNATVHPGGASNRVYFEYGLTIGYGSSSTTNTLLATNTVLSTSNAIAGLTAGTLYHFRAVSSNSVGRINGSDLTFTTAAIAPAITAPTATSITSTGATLNTAVNPNGADTRVYFQYGLTTGYGSFSATNLLTATNVSVLTNSVMSGLAPATLYHYQVVASNSIGTVSSSDQTFTTIAVPGIVAASATAITATGATLNTSVNPNGAATVVYFQYGQTASYGGFSATNSLVATNVAFVTNSIIAGLAPGTLYHYQVVAANSVGTVSGSDQTFNTATAAPAISTTSATGITGTGAILNTAVNPNGDATTVYFRYGQTASYGSFSATNLLAATNVSVLTNSVITGLAPATLYHYQVVAANGVGTVSSSDQTFNTGSAAPSFLAVSATTNTASAATLSSSVNPNGAATAVYFQYGLTTNYGSFSGTNLLAATNAPVASSNALTGLLTGAVYHYQAVASNNFGTVSNTDLTLTLPAAVPGVTTMAATNFTGTEATLNALVNPAGLLTSLYFEYGETTAYGNATVPAAVPSIGLNFNGSNQWAQLISNLSGLNTGNSAHTIEAWINPTLLHSSREWTLLLGNAGNGAHHWLFNADGTTQIGVYGGNQVNPRLTPNVWMHLAVAFDGTIMSVYTNGILVGSTNASFNLLGIPLTVAQAHGDSFYGGGMDELRIWNVGRSAAQIQANLNAPLTGSETNLIAYWRMNEGAGALLSDASGHGNTLQLSNSQAWFTGAPMAGISSGQNYLQPGFISSLTPLKTYHFRAVGSNSLGLTYGGDLTFSMPARSPLISTQGITGLTPTNATLNAQLNPGGADTVYYFQYALTTAYGNFTPTNSLAATNIFLAVSNLITGLSPGGIVYHYRMVATNSLGNSISPDQIFLTGAIAPVVTTQPATSTSLTSALLNASVNPEGADTSFYFQYGLTTNYGNVTGTISLPATNLNLTTNLTVTGLAPGMIYHFQAVGSNSVGLSVGGDLTFASSGLPIVSVQPATAVTTTGATLDGLVTPNGSSTGVWFEWGIGMLFDHQTAPQIFDPLATAVTFSNQLTGLTAGAAYHYRVAASNAVGIVRSRESRFWSPRVLLSGNALMTNLINTLFTDPGANVTASPQAISAGDVMALALRADGTVVQWGTDIGGGNIVPTLTNIVAVKAAQSGCVALKNDGTLVAWGSYFSATNVPASVTNVIEVEVSQQAVMALRADGVLVKWGESSFSTPTAATNPITFALGDTGAAMIRADGTVLGWGNYNTGIPANATNLTAIVAGEVAYLALRADGTIFSWGNNGYAQTNIPVGAASNIVAIGGGYGYDLALRNDGTIFGWGNNGYTYESVPASATNIVALSSERFFNLAMRADGSMVEWITVGSDPSYYTVPTNLNILNLPLGVSGTVNTNTLGTYTITYSTTNIFGAVDSSTRTVFVVPVIGPSVTTQPATAMVSTQATLNGTINPNGTNTDYYFQYGLTTNYGSVTPSRVVPTGYAVVPLSESISNLAPATLYHFKLMGSNSAGSTNGVDLTFTTPSDAPSVTVQAASGIAATVATLNGTINPNGAATAYFFQYGLSTNYTAVSSTNFLSASTILSSVSNAVIGLTLGGTYHFRLVASNSFGLNNSGDQTFITQSRPVVTLLPATSLTGPSATLNAMINPNGDANYYFQYGLTTSYGSQTPLQTIAANSPLNFNAVTFSGTNQYGFLTTLNGLSSGNTAHTIEGWVNPAGLPSNRAWILSLGNIGTGCEHWLLGTNGVLQLGVYGGAQLNPVLSPNVWTHLAASFDGTNYNVYTNGVLAGSVNAAFNLGGVSLSLARSYLSDNFFKGGMAEVRVWNTNRTASQIQAGMNGALTGNEVGLIAYYRMNEAAAVTSFADWSSHSNTIPLTGIPVRNFPGQNQISQIVSNLSLGALYHFQAVASNGFGLAYSGDLTFLTPTNPTVTTLAVTTVTTTTATLNGAITANGADANIFFQYGLTTNYGSATANSFLAASNISLTVSPVVTSLDGYAVYHFRAVGSNSAGVTFGSDQAFLTLSVPPLAITQPATGVSGTIATLNGLANPKGSNAVAWFEWGLGDAFNQRTAPVSVGSNGLSVAYSEQLTGLMIGLPYHYRAMVSNVYGVYRGQIKSFSAPILTLNGADVITNVINTPFVDPGTVASSAPQAMTGGYYDSAVLRADGRITAWGLSGVAATNIPASVTNTIGLTGGNQYYTVALQANGTPVGWGYTPAATVSTNATNLASIYGNTDYCLGLGSNGTLMGWGPNWSFGNVVTLTGAADVTNVVAVAAGFSFFMGLRSDGALLAKGNNNYGQSTIPAKATNLVMIAAGDYHALGLRADGSLIGWGNNQYGQTNIPAAVTNVIAIAANSFYCLALRADGTVIGWGNNSAGQLTIPSSATNVISITACLSHCLALRADGTLISWGQNSRGETNVPVVLNNMVTPASVSDTLLTNQVGTYTLTYAVTNVFGGFATTTRTVVVVPSAPAVVTVGANNVTASSASLAGTVNPSSAATAYYFQYGLTTNYGNWTQTNNLIAANAVIAVGNNLAGLAPLTVYHYQVVASNSYGVAFGADQTFLTLPAAPTVATQAATPITNTAAILNGSVNPNGGNSAYYFQYGLTTAYGSVTTINPLSATNISVAVSNALAGLAPGTTYHFQLVASNVSGLVSGGDQSFFTLSSAPTVIPQPATVIAGLSATLNTLVNPNGAAATVYFQYGTNASYGSVTPVNLVAGTNISLAVSGGLTNLSALTLYHFRVVASNTIGVTIGDDQTLTTVAAAPSVATQPAVGITRTEAVLNGLINPNNSASAWYFQYGLTTNYGSVSGTNSLAATNSVFAVSNTLAGLSVGSLYHYRIVGTNGTGISFGADNVFATLSAPPVVTTLSASSITGSNAVLNGLVNPNGTNTTAWMEWGVGTIYVQQTLHVDVGNGSAELNFSNLLTGWAGGWSGHYRSVASNLFGVVRGRDVRFWAPGLSLAGASVMTNALNSAFIDPGTILTASPRTVAAGYFHSLALRADGTITPWGNNDYSQTNVPANATNVVALAAGELFSVALRADGSLVAWGDDSSGQLDVPSNATNIVSISAGPEYVVAARANGTVVAWGSSSYSQLNSITNAANLTNIVSVAAGQSHFLGLRADGTVAALGNNIFGQSNVPAGATNVTAVAVGDFHSLALRADGTVIAWGSNASGQTNVPAGATNILAISAQSAFNLALRADGRLLAWGNNQNSKTIVPTNVTNVIAISAGQQYALALRLDGTVISWGNDDFAQGDVPVGLNTLNLQVTTTGSVITNAPGTYVLTYTATNSLGAISTVTRTVIVPGSASGSAPVIKGLTVLTNGSFQFAFTNTPGASFSVLASTNVGTPLTNWLVLTNVIEGPAGQFRFTTPQAGYPMRFFRVQSP